MRVLVIGGTRYAGRRLVRHLLDDGHAVTILTRGTTPDPFGDSVTRITMARQDLTVNHPNLKDHSWDVVVDQVCFSLDEARSTCDALASRMGRYIVTSSQSVYTAGADIAESAYEPATHPLTTPVDPMDDYAEAKRQVEAAVAQYAPVPWTTVRFPLIVAADDYSGRLAWHVERLRNGLPIHVPVPAARMSFIHADDAGLALHHLVTTAVDGPINVAAPVPMAVASFISSLAAAVGVWPKYSDIATTDTISPYGIPEDWYMSVERLEHHGLVLRPIESWIGDLVP